MKTTVMGAIDDLRARRLLPVAILLLAALMAAPVFLLKSAGQAPPPATPVATATPSTTDTGGLPSPEEALQDGKPLVTLATLEQPSDLKSFDNKNPFKPLESLQKPGTVNNPFGPGAKTLAGGGSPAGGSTGGGTGGLSPGGKSLTPVPSLPGGPGPAPAPAPREQFTYTVDLTFDGPGAARHYRNLPRLRMLPDENSPLFVFLGVDASGNKAVFLVDSTLKSLGGEGTCSPSPGKCGTLSIEPGERQTFQDDAGQTYVIEIDQIRQTSVTKAAAAERRLSTAAAKSARLRKDTGGKYAGLERRFSPPVLVDILTGVQQ